MALGGWIARSMAVWALVLVHYVAAESYEVSAASSSDPEPALLDDNYEDSGPSTPKIEDLGTEHVLLKLITSLRTQEAQPESQLKPKWTAIEKQNNQFEVDTKNSKYSEFKEPPTKRSAGEDVPILNFEGRVQHQKWELIHGRVVELQPLCLRKLCPGPPPIEIIE